MIITKYPGTGYVINPNPEAGREQNRITNSAYETPYQFTTPGRLVVLDLSSTYDADATPTVVVAVPASSGVYVDGWTFVSTYKTHPLPGATNELFPYTADCTATDANNIAYAEDYTKWTAVTVSPLIPGDIVGIPVAASTNLVVGTEVAASIGGYAKAAVSTNWVIGKVEVAANNSSGAAGAKNATVRICNPYVKS